jgi:hypothetical protein
VLIVPNEIYRRVGGMHNNYWGWDMEDNEFNHQLERFNVTIKHQSKDIGTSYDNTFLHLHNTKMRSRDYRACKNHSYSNTRRERAADEGLDFTKYNLLDVQELEIEGFKTTFLNVQLICDTNKAPWCDC